MSKLLLSVLMIFSLQLGQIPPHHTELNQPYSYEVLKQDLKKLKRHYKKEIQIKTIGTSHFGREIYAIKLGRGKKNIVLIGAHHGREWMTSMLLMKKLDGYAHAYQRTKPFGDYSTDILDEVSIWFVPMLNPDGVAIQQNQLHHFPAKYRKKLLKMNQGVAKFDRWKANGMGIDLNRQYPAGWYALKKTPTKPFYQFYKGKRPVQAKEVRALIRFIRKIDPSIAVAYHSAGREIFWNYHNGKYLKRDKMIAKKVAELADYQLGKPPKHAVGGGFTDWFITTYHRPAMTVEISPLVGEKSPPLAFFAEEWRRNQYVGLMLAKEAKKINKNR